MNKALNTHIHFKERVSVRERARARERERNNFYKQATPSSKTSALSTPAPWSQLPSTGMSSPSSLVYTTHQALQPPRSSATNLSGAELTKTCTSGSDNAGHVKQAKHSAKYDTGTFLQPVSVLVTNILTLFGHFHHHTEPRTSSYLSNSPPDGLNQSP